MNSRNSIYKCLYLAKGLPYSTEIKIHQRTHSIGRSQDLSLNVSFFRFQVSGDGKKGSRVAAICDIKFIKTNRRFA